jgi:hypothetical protein
MENVRHTYKQSLDISIRRWRQKFYLLKICRRYFRIMLFIVYGVLLLSFPNTNNTDGIYYIALVL